MPGSGTTDNPVTAETEYAYDRTDQLHDVDYPTGTDPTFVWDENGNALGSPTVVGEHNRLEHYGLYEWEYDEEGNVVLRIDETPTGDIGDKVEFEWDHRNRLTKIVMSKDTEAGAGITWTVDRTVTFEYDAFDRRIEKRRINPGQGTPSLDNVSYYVYDGSDIVLRFDRDENLRNRYLHGPAVDQVLAEEQYTSSGNPAANPGATYWTATDHLGSVRQLIDNNSTEARRASYDVWGRPGTITGVVTIYGYTGREYDTETRFQYNRARYYDSVSHRWLSEDPLGLGPDENPYRYVHNQPTNYTDPSGEFGHILGGAIAGGLIGAATKIGGSLISGNGMPSWGDVGIAALEGAVGGAVAAAFPGAGGVAAGIAKRIVGAAIQGAKVGAAAGAVAGAAASVTRQYCEKGKVEVKQVLKDAGEGALIGAIAGAIVGAAGQAWKEAKNAAKGQGPKPADSGKPAEQPKPADQPKPANQPKPADQPKPMGDGLPDTSGDADVPLPPIPKPRFGGRARPPFRPALRDPRSTALSPTTPDGKYIYAQDPDGVVHVLPVDAPGGHASVLGGSNTAIASYFSAKLRRIRSSTSVERQAR